MKYIRFEDGSINRDYEVGLLCPIPIVKESEKLEDLCDQFVMFDENNEFLIANNNFSAIKDIWNRRENRIINVYGEIWLRNELRKVAEMNDKGEFGLL